MIFTDNWFWSCLEIKKTTLSKSKYAYKVEFFWGCLEFVICLYHHTMIQLYFLIIFKWFHVSWFLKIKRIINNMLNMPVSEGCGSLWFGKWSWLKTKFAMPAFIFISLSSPRTCIMPESRVLKCTSILISGLLQSSWRRTLPQG